ncbi:hypothetical protein [Streptomyces glomeratus]|uniref:hypothetical protein n=1 Tax=Streptomyces glomeratus TaxID=284452 RepID=UPI001F301CB4|nr:hypothetical protein [Streptomyces glomeratus]MCF1509657.1 hypothetical protein [Streptomyces glomeratus]
MHRPEPTRSALVRGALAVVTVAWSLLGAVAHPASADACAYASTGPDGTAAVAVAGGDLPPPPCLPPSPTPTPEPTPPPQPPPRVTPPPRPGPVPKPVPPPHTAAPRPRPAPVLAPPPTPEPVPAPSHRPSPSPSATPLHYPAYHAVTHPRQPHDSPSPLMFTLLIAAPAVFAVAALRPR